MRHLASWFPDQGQNSHPLHWKWRILTTGLPGKSQWMIIFLSICMSHKIQVSCLLPGSPMPGQSPVLRPNLRDGYCYYVPLPRELRPRRDE